MLKEFENYIKELQSIPLNEITEHTHRTNLQNLLNAIKNNFSKKVQIIHEPKRVKKYGAPDFKISHADSTIGYIENKKIEENLNKILNSDQIKKYKEYSAGNINILLTNYIEWVWIKGDVITTKTLCGKEDLENKSFKPDSRNVEEVKKLIENFFSQPPSKTGKPEDLAKYLANKTKILKEILFVELQRQEKEHQEGKLFGIFKTFKENISSELMLEEFADTFAQMFSYGLFLAKLNANNKSVNLDNAKRFIPASFALIRELISFIDEFEKDEYEATKWIVEEIISIINNLDLESILTNLSFDKNKKNVDFPVKDPYVHFYEDFLSVYDKGIRVDRGVYYTPIPVVKFIIRAINDVLKNEFGIAEGLIDRGQVTLLDFATGTGTFLLEVLEQVFEKIPESSGKKNSIIKEHILKNFYGFEYLITPYTIAHLKLSQFLKDKGYELKDDDRFQIYLANTLDYQKEIQANLLLQALTEEGRQAKKIKETPVLVITGNPPYNVKSKNKSDWILDLLKSYKPSDETKLNLDDDYIKFIRFAHHKMESVENGVIGVITNNSFLSGLTHRKMRNELLKEFSSIYVLNLHGNSNIGEKTPEGYPDKNVFDIKQGVGITIFVKNRNKKEDCKVFYYDLWGKREDKFRFLYEYGLDGIDFKELPISKFNKDFKSTRWGKDRFKDNLSFFNTYENIGELLNYGKLWGITDIFYHYNSGIQTKRDDLTINFYKKELENTIKDFQNFSDNEIKIKYKLPEDGRDWTIQKAKESLNKENYNNNNINQIAYRPFDKRWTYLNQKSKGFLAYPRYETMKHFVRDENIGLSFSRQIISDSWRHIFATKEITEGCLVSIKTREWTYTTPLYLYETEEEFKQKINTGKSQLSLLQTEPYQPKRENFKPEFREFINKKYNKIYTPEEILGYIYAVMHSPTYREKYLEFLKIDFPRVPFADDPAMFEELSKLGFELIQKHLMNDIPAIEFGNYKGSGNNEVLKPELRKDKLYINKTQYFDKVLEEVYNFQIGGYKVLEHYLKARKGRMLSLDEIENVEKVIKILAFTIEQMQKIDELTKEWI